MFKIVERLAESDETCSSNQSSIMNKAGSSQRTRANKSLSSIIKVKKESDTIICKLQGQLKKIDFMNEKKFKVQENSKTKKNFLDGVRKENILLKDALKDKALDDLSNLEIKKSKVMLVKKVSKANLLTSKERVFKKNVGNNHFVRVGRVMNESYIKDRENQYLKDCQVLKEKVKMNHTRGFSSHANGDYEFEDSLLRELRNQQNMISELELALSKQLSISSTIQKID